MNLSDTWLSLGAMSVELGLPALLVLAMAFKPAARPRAIVLLGAVFPALCLYGSVTANYGLSRGVADGFAFYAMWVMTFAPYVAIALGGALVSLLRWPAPLWARFGLGVVSMPLAYAVFVLLARAARLFD